MAENGTGTGLVLPKLSFTTSIPETTRGRGKAGAENPYQKFMVDMPAPKPASKAKDAPLQFAQFFVPSEVPATVTDPTERDKAGKDGCQKLINRFTSISRRIKKANGAAYNYTFRKARDPSAAAGTTGQWGIIVYRVQPVAETPKPAAGAATGAVAT